MSKEHKLLFKKQTNKIPQGLNYTIQAYESREKMPDLTHNREIQIKLQLQYVIIFHILDENIF